MICYIGLGSNLGDRLSNLEIAAQKIKNVSKRPVRASPIFQTKALLPQGAPANWNIDFLNAAIEVDWEGSPLELLRQLKKIEKEMGRIEIGRWAPRIIDLDILLFDAEIISGGELTIPHPGLFSRSFALDPLKHLIPSFVPPGQNRSILKLAKTQVDSVPLFMNIFNITPDSFSDGGEYKSVDDIERKISELEKHSISIFDIGAESTRPNAALLTSDEEWQRLEPVLHFFHQKYRHKIFKPKVSLDTRHPQTVARAFEYGIDIINDVSGLANLEMLNFLTTRNCDYVLMHSLTVPADSKVVLNSNLDPVKTLKDWAVGKLKIITDAGIPADRIIFDPGIGFGKTAEQSLRIIQRIEEFSELPVRILLGHSRKSFFKLMSDLPAKDRDPESIAASLKVMTRKIDILRVHNADLHARAYRAFKNI